MARCNFQSDVVDYTEIYDPVACIELVDPVMSVVVRKRWAFDEVDFNSAFLHAGLPDRATFG